MSVELEFGFKFDDDGDYNNETTTEVPALTKRYHNYIIKLTISR